MKLFFINENKLNSEELKKDILKNTKYSLTKSKSEYTVKAKYKKEEIGELYFELLEGDNLNTFFQNEFKEEDVKKLFPNGKVGVIQFVKINDDKYKRLGVANKLMKLTMDKINQLGYKQIYLNAEPEDNTLSTEDLVKFYEKLNFTPIKNLGISELTTEPNSVQMIYGYQKAITEHKSFIKQILKEAVGDNAQFATEQNLRNTIIKVLTARNFVMEQEDSVYWNSDTNGDYIASVTVRINGDLGITTHLASARDVKNHGEGWRGQNKFTMRAYRGIEHPNTEKEREGYAQTIGGVDNTELVNHLSNNNVLNKDELNYLNQLLGNQNIEPIEVKLKYGSPASDAQIKSYALYGDEIIRYVLQHTQGYKSYLDGKGREIASKQNDPEKYKILKSEIKRLIKMPDNKTLTDKLPNEVINQFNQDKITLNNFLMKIQTDEELMKYIIKAQKELKGGN